MKNNAVWALIVMCVLLAAGNYYQYAKVKALHRQPAFFKTDQGFVDDAVEHWAKVARESPDKAMSDRYAVALHFPEEVCVELRLNLGSAGGSPVYCFDRQSRTVTRKFVSVE